MLEKFLTRVAAIVAGAYRRIAAVPFVRRVTYPLRNQRGFTDLYEHDKMLADHVRVDTYAAAIAKQVKPGDDVIDLGTGSSILAFLAARAGARVVHAIDHSPFIASARRVAADNGVSNIEFHQVHSGRFHPSTAADVIVHEQIGEALFDERMVESSIDLRDRVLKPGGRIVPARFELHLDPVELIDDAVVPFGREHIDSSPFARSERRPTRFMNPLLRVEAMKVDAGEDLELALDATDLATPGTWTWSCRHV